MKKITSAGIIIYRMYHNEPLYLILKYAAGHWDFSKGHLEKDESLVVAAERELHEETGLTADITLDFEESFSYFLNDPHTGELCFKTVHFFVGSVSTDVIKFSHEHVDYQWLPYKKAVDRLTYDNAREALYKAHQYIESLT